MNDLQEQISKTLLFQIPEIVKVIKNKYELDS